MIWSKCLRLIWNIYYFMGKIESHGNSKVTLHTNAKCIVMTYSTAKLHNVGKSNLISGLILIKIICFLFLYIIFFSPCCAYMSYSLPKCFKWTILDSGSISFRFFSCWAACYTRIFFQTHKWYLLDLYVKSRSWNRVTMWNWQFQEFQNFILS